MSDVIEYTVKEFAARERVDERTVRRWVHKQAVEFRRTPGGRLRIIVERQTSRALIMARTYSDIRGHSAT